jgi:Cyclin, N-terminal domain
MVSRVQSWRELDLDLVRKRTAESAAQSDALANLSAHDENPLLFADENYLERVYGKAMGPMTRTALVRWMFKAARKCSILLPREVAALATNYLDRVMNAIVVRHSALQGLAAACLQLASKVSHGFASPCHAVGIIKSDLRFELPILQALRWRLVVPTVFSFIPILAASFWIADQCIPLAGRSAEHFTNREFARISEAMTHL